MKFRNYTDYEVYEDGRIYSYKRKKFLKPATLPNGYKQVCITDNEGKAKCYLLHRVIWEAVTGSPIPSDMEINHRSEDKTENFFENLELMLHKDNCNFGTRNSRIRKAHSNNKNSSKAHSNNKNSSKALKNNPKLSKQVGAYKDCELVMVFPSTMEAQRQGYNSGNVSACCNNCYLREGNNFYKGYIWKYI